MKYLKDPDFTLYNGDAVEILKTLPAESVHMCVTSPPYYGLRDYSAEGQLGLEATPDLYLERMVAVFREVRRVLRLDGTLWCNMGDSFQNKQKQMIPARLALALQADGWFLRGEIVWSKPNPMPESVTDRPTTSHEFVYLLAKSPRYFFDQEAVREPHRPDGRSVTTRTVGNGSHDNYQEFDHDEGRERWPNAGRNLRSVWEIPTQPYPEAHFATYPEELVRRCILAGSSERGCCPECGAPWVREMERTGYTSEPVETKRLLPGAKRKDGDRALSGPNQAEFKRQHPDICLGWKRSCEHDWQIAINPCTVLDPFLGSGTTALVARKHGRRTIGIELSGEYCVLASRRLSQLSLLAEV